MTKVLQFLNGLVSEDNLAGNTVKGYLTAISKRHDKVLEGNLMLRISELEKVRLWSRGLSVKYPPTRILVPEWSLDVVLSALKKPPYYDKDLCLIGLKRITQRTAFLVALTTARRASEIHALTCSTIRFGANEAVLHLDASFLPKVNSEWHVNCPIVVPASFNHDDRELRKLCVRSSLLAYVNSTKHMRPAAKSDQLFLAYGGKTKGQPISVQRISNWLCELIEDCYKLMGLPPPGSVKGHQVRKAAASWADVCGVSPDLIRQAATWQSSNMFARHYRLDVVRANATEFSTRILQAAASSSAEAALRSTLKRTSPARKSKR